MEEFIKIGIQPKGNRRQQKVICPNCIQIGKTNIQDTCLSIDLNEGLYNCHKCGWHGKVKTDNYNFMEFKKEYIKPTKQNMTNLNDRALAYFESRGINQTVINNNKIVCSKDGNNIVFPYFRDGELVNYKTRGIDEKKFMQAKDAEPIMYNLDRLEGVKEIIYCEGEIDGLSFEVAGYTNFTSVNQGAPNVNDRNIDKKLECIDNCIEVLEKAEVHIIAVDNDENGNRLKNELVRRLGAENCKIVDFKDCKDANEYLVRYGAFELSNAVKNAKFVKVEGVFKAEDVMSDLLHSFRHGDLDSESTHIQEVDMAWKWRKTEVTMWTGYQNEGKSLFLNQLCLLKALKDGDKFAFFSPENMPLKDFFGDLIESYVGKTTDINYPHHRMTENEFIGAIGAINHHFHLIYPEENFTLDTIFNKVKFLIKRHGIKHLIIDPYNTIEHQLKNGEREDLYISRFMGRLKRFAIDNQITIQLVAHQLTAKQNLNDGGRYFKPNLNAIKGGGTFADKSDNVCFVWRPDRAIDFSSTKVIFGSQKIKKQRLVGIPQDIEMDFKRSTQRYTINGVSPFEELDKLRDSYYEEKIIPTVEPKDAFDLEYNTNNEIPF